MFIKKRFYFGLLILLTFKGVAQDVIPQKSVDSLYREDQFYFGVMYNIISPIPQGSIESNGLSGGIQFGFLRDMPINKQRNIAIAIGAGFSLDQYGQNIIINKDINGETTFTIIDDTTLISANRLNVALFEIPIEIRWRSSTPTTYKFWRVYAGFRIGYAFWNKSTFKQAGNTISINNIPEFDKLRLGTTLSFGYSTFNFFAYYSINPFFNNEIITTNGQQIDFKTLKLGLNFYIL